MKLQNDKNQENEIKGDEHEITVWWHRLIAKKWTLKVAKCSTSDSGSVKSKNKATIKIINWNMWTIKD